MVFGPIDGMQKLVDLYLKFRKTVALKFNEWMEWLEMKKIRRLENSRDDWKEKARIRGEELREQRRARNVDRVQIKLQRDEIRRMKVQLKKKTNRQSQQSLNH
jgi:hypothetical protein